MTEPIGCCSGCDRTWNNTGQAHCAAPGCHRHFSSTRAFDMHFGRIPASGPTPCRDPAKLRNRDGSPKLVERDGVWHRPGERPPRTAEGVAATPGQDSPGRRGADALRDTSGLADARSGGAAP
jgi:hypothetical protein